MISTIVLNKNWIWKLAAALCAILVWQGAAWLLGSDILLASPWQVACRLVSLMGEGSFWTSLLGSFLDITWGFLLSLGLGALLAVAAGKSRVVEILLAPYMVTIKTVPVASFIVIALVWLSSRDLSVFISFLMGLPIVYTNLLQGIKSRDEKLWEMAEVFRMGPGRRFLTITLPQIKPYLLSACSLALGLSWKAGIAAEVIGIPEGTVGEALYNAKIYLATADLFAWTLMVVLLSIVFEKIFLLLVRWAFARLERI
ncbi:MAG: ABC transporter permease subunit [Ruminococcaceae bacterium]|nr:ABC transporter permease subunit [Oscillospiraceae bacterium]